jgi:hypothetical protein
MDAKRVAQGASTALGIVAAASAARRTWRSVPVQLTRMTWDDMPVTLEQAYRSQGRKAQQAFWGHERPESSMLHQIALRTA